jgi:lysozyme
MSMVYSKSGLALTERFEGVKLVAYPDQHGTWTIAYGHTAGVYEGMTCTADQAEQWLIEDTAWAEATVNKYVTRQVTQGEFDAMVDFTFNLGTGSFQHSTLLQMVDQGNFAAAADEFARWDKCGGQVVAGLLRRRIAEEQEFNS